MIKVVERFGVYKTFKVLGLVFTVSSVWHYSSMVVHS